ncbi:MAG: hypothetical protein Fur0039_26330 [Rhodocyclaceae bacterium]
MKLVCPRRARQGGAALFIALIALVFMLLGGLALVRSVDTANLIAGNFSFRRAALQASDAGVEAAFALLDGTIATASADAAYPAGCSPAAPTNCSYFPTRRALDGSGVPVEVGDWSNLPATTLPNGNTYRFVIDRLCKENPPDKTKIIDYCIAGQQTVTASKKLFGFSGGGSAEVYYRATVRVEGPRNTVTTVQVLFSR